ncbi:hypothetical protein D3C81_2071040 [compost metagenome]
MAVRGCGAGAMLEGASCARSSSHCVMGGLALARIASGAKASAAALRTCCFRTRTAHKSSRKSVKASMTNLRTI